MTTNLDKEKMEKLGDHLQENFSSVSSDDIANILVYIVIQYSDNPIDGFELIHRAGMSLSGSIKAYKAWQGTHDEDSEAQTH